MPIILGLDISSTTIGYAVINTATKRPKIVVLDHFKPPKKGTLFERLDKTGDKIQAILDEYKPDIVAIEECAVGFSRGFTTPQTLIMLASFNRCCGMICYEYLDKKSPELYTVMKIRHGIKVGEAPPKKEDLPELLAKRLGIKFPYVMRKKRDGSTVIASESYDRSDALAVAVYASIKLKEEKKR